jgi:hypothetical protein
MVKGDDTGRPSGLHLKEHPASPEASFRKGVALCLAEALLGSTLSPIRPMAANWVAAPSDEKIGAAPPAARGRAFRPASCGRGRRPAAASRLPKRRLRTADAKPPTLPCVGVWAGLCRPRRVPRSPWQADCCGRCAQSTAIGKLQARSEPDRRDPHSCVCEGASRGALGSQVAGGRHGRGRRPWRRRSPLQEWSKPHAQAGAGGR